MNDSDLIDEIVRRLQAMEPTVEHRALLAYTMLAYPDTTKRTAALLERFARRIGA